MTFVDDDGDGRGEVEVLGRFGPAGSTHCAVQGRWLAREQGDVWFEMSAQVSPFLADLEVSENVLVIERSFGRTVLQRVEEVPDSARCQLATELRRLPTELRGPGWLGYDGTDLHVEWAYGELRTLSRVDATLGSVVALDATFDEPLAFWGSALWAGRGTSWSQIALLDPIPQVTTTLNLTGQLGLDLAVRSAAVDGGRLYLHGSDGQDNRVGTVDLDVSPPALLADVVVQPLCFDLFTHRGELWCMEYQHADTVLVELDPLSGRILRTVELPDTAYARSLVGVGDSVFATVIDSLDTALVEYELPPAPDVPVLPESEVSPALAITATPSSLQLLPGSRARLRVLVDRTDLAGEVDVSVTGLPPEVTSDPLTLGPDVTLGDVWLEATGALQRDRSPITVTVTVTDGPDTASTPVELRFPAARMPGGVADAFSILDLPVGDGEQYGGEIDVDSLGRRVVATQTRKDGDYRSQLQRVRPDGTLDPTFGAGGVVQLAGDLVESLVVLPDDGVVIAGRDQTRNWAPFLERYDASGSRMPSFGANTQPALQSASYGVVGVLVDGADIVYGDGASVRRFDLAGNEDPSARYDAEYPGSIRAIGSDGAGSVYVSLSWSLEYDGPVIDRIDATGANDLSFGVDGRLTMPTDRYHGGVWRFVPTDDGGAIALSLAEGSSSSTSSAFLVRFDAAGVLDPTFGDGGVVETLYGTWSPYPPPMVRIADQIVVAGAPQREDAPSVARRFGLDGTPDPTFGLTEMVDLPAWPTSMAYDPVSGELVAVVVHKSIGRVELVRIPL